MTLSTSQYRELRRHFSKGEYKGSVCVACGNAARHGWWEKVNTEYDEWECYCGQCAYEHLHQYDDFDADLYQRISEGKE